MIEAVGLTKRYGRTVAVDDLSFTARPGVVTGFLGPNGAGKSTTMRMVLGLDRPDTGFVLIDGRRFDELRRPLRVRPARREVGAPAPDRAQPPALAGPSRRHAEDPR
jgi:ABC-2 type transport system ATP-binding protein